MNQARLIAVLFGAALAALSGCAPTGSFKVTALPKDQTLHEETVLTESIWTANRIALIDISGILMNSHELGMFSEGEHPVSLLSEKLRIAEEDGRVKAVVLRINSPGGSVTASDTMYEEVLAFRKKTGKPVVAYFQDVAASGAYYVACAADEIIAQRTSVTGSIGVIMQMVDLTGTMALIGVKAEAITSGPYKDAGSPFKEMSPEDRKIFQGLVDGFYQQFINVLAAGRPRMGRERILTIADGRVYNAQQALEDGLIDSIATLPEAIEAAKKRAGVTVANTVRYHRPLDWTPNIYARSPENGGPTFNLLNINVPFIWTRTPCFMYIWSIEG